MHDSLPFEADIIDPCDRHPSARAMTVWYRPTDRALLTLCVHCSDRNEIALVEDSFELSIDNREDLLPVSSAVDAE